MIQPEPPLGWGNDELSKFIDNATANTYATFHNLKTDYTRLSGTDAALRRAVENLSNSEDWFAGFFLMRAHASYLAALRLVFGGQVAETYSCLRQAIEQTLYGFYLSRNPASRETWLLRHTSEQARRRVRDEFTIRALLAALEAVDAKEARAVQMLYDDTIDYGAHPNERGLVQGLKMVKGEGRLEFQVSYLLRGDSPACILALRRAAQVGVCILRVFGLVFRERFEILGLADDIRRLTRGL